MCELKKDTHTVYTIINTINDNVWFIWYLLIMMKEVYQVLHLLYLKILVDIKLTLIIQEVCLDLEKMKVVFFLVIYVL